LPRLLKGGHHMWWAIGRRRLAVLEDRERDGDERCIETTWTKGPAAGDAARVAPAALSLLDDRGRGEAAAVDLAHRRHRRSGDRVTAENADRVDRVGDDSDSDLTADDRVTRCLAVAVLAHDPEEARVP